MSALERFHDGLAFTGGLSAKECSVKRQDFYKCVSEKKNELSKTIENWNTYSTEIRNYSQECFDNNGLASCSNYFSFTDLKY